VGGCGRLLGLWGVVNVMGFGWVGWAGLTVLDEVQADAANDGDFVCGHGTEELLDGDFLIRDLCVCRKDVAVCYADHFGLQARGFGRAADVEIWGWQDGLTPQFAAICGDEADQSVPVRCHLEYFMA
jgi:hypothetical protein